MRDGFANVDMNDFGSYIQKLRLNNGLPQKVVSEKIGIDISLFSKIEHGERQEHGHMLKTLAKLFDLNYKGFKFNF